MMILSGSPDHIVAKFHYNIPNGDENDELILYDQTTRTFFIHTPQLEPAKFTGNVGNIFHLKIENLKTKAEWQFVYEQTREYKSKCGGVIRYREYIHTHLNHGQQRYYAHLYATRLMLETAWSDVRKDIDDERAHHMVTGQAKVDNQFMVRAENALIDILSDTMKNDIDKHIISVMKSRNGSKINE
jgi:hypothetical protein